MDVVLFFLDGSMSPPTKHHLFNQEFNYAFTWAARDWPPALTSAGKKPPPPRPTADGYAQPPCSRSGTGPAGFSGGAQVRPREKGGEPWRESGVGANRKKRSKTWCEGTAAPGSTENTERRFPPTRCGDTVSPEMEIRSPGVRLPGDARSAALFISVVENLLNGRTQTPTPELMSDSAFLLICPFFLHFLLFERKQFELICWALPNMVFIIIHLTSYLASFIKTCLKKNKNSFLFFLFHSGLFQAKIVVFLFRHIIRMNMQFCHYRNPLRPGFPALMVGLFYGGVLHRESHHWIFRVHPNFETKLSN